MPKISNDLAKSGHHDGAVGGPLFTKMTSLACRKTAYLVNKGGRKPRNRKSSSSKF